MCDDDALTAHNRYLKLYELIPNRDKDIQQAFDDFRRTTALTCLTSMWQLGLVTQAELDRFSLDTRRQVLRD